MKNPLTWLSKRRFPYTPLITIEISRSRLIHNINQFIKLAPESRLAPALKSNAYGHGIIEIAEIIEGEIRRDNKFRDSIPFFVIDSYFEAIALRAKGIKTPLLIIGYTRPETILNSSLKNVSYAATDMETLGAIKNSKKVIFIHLKIDTGMHRQGILPEEVDEAIKYLKLNNKIVLEGICSHLSDADGQDSTFTDRQVALWNNIVDQISSSIPSIKYFHLSNTYGHLYSKSIKANVSRLGIGMYGLADALREKMDLQPILQMKTIITSVKKLKMGDTVGYNNTFKSDRNMTIATIPVGYYEGLDRRLSNIGAVEVLPDNISCPIIGRVSMNITSIDVSLIKDIKIGSEVIVVSNNSNSKCSIEAISKLCNTITYESSIMFPENLKRVVVE